MAAKKKERWVVYIIQTKSGNFYTGITTDLERRFAEHSKVDAARTDRGARFFNISRPEKILFRERHKNRSAATVRENEIKSMTRQEKWDLIQEHNRP